MYILFESNTTEKGRLSYFSSWDCMGHAVTEEDAMSWRDKNPEFRRYQYCPDKVKN